MTTVEKTKEMLFAMGRSGERWALVKLWNKYCEENNCLDDVIYDNNIDEMDNYFSSIADFYHSMGDYVESDDFFSFDEYGMLNSYDCLDNPNSPVDFDALAEWAAADE